MALDCVTESHHLTSPESKLGQNEPNGQNIEYNLLCERTQGVIYTV